MADFILNDLNTANENFPIKFELQFDIDRQKMLNYREVNLKSLDELDEEGYYNLCYFDSIDKSALKPDCLDDNFKQVFSVFCPTQSC